jgi:phospholipid transport system substrate-binding protein
LFTTAVIALAGVCNFIFPLAVLAETPLKQLEKDIGELTEILDDKEYRKTHTKDELKEKLIKTAEGRFNWEEIAKRSLGLYWKERSVEEQKEFTLLLKDLLISSYLDKIIDNYSGEKVLFDKEVLKGDRAYIEFRIINKAETSIALGARMKQDKEQDKEQWMIYDLVIESVSSVKNYRVQFYDIIRQSSYDELVKKLREKVKKLKEEQTNIQK